MWCTLHLVVASTNAWYLQYQIWSISCWQWGYWFCGKAGVPSLFHFLSTPIIYLTMANHHDKQRKMFVTKHLYSLPPTFQSFYLHHSWSILESISYPNARPDLCCPFISPTTTKFIKIFQLFSSSTTPHCVIAGIIVPTMIVAIIIAPVVFIIVIVASAATYSTHTSIIPTLIAALMAMTIIVILIPLFVPLVPPPYFCLSGVEKDIIFRDLNNDCYPAI